MNRRGFLSSILIAGCAPAIVRAESLMKCNGLIVPTGNIWLPTHIEWLVVEEYNKAMWPNLKLPHTQATFELVMQMKEHYPIGATL